MMRIWLLSDLHLESSDFDLPAPPAGVELLVVAGDVHENWGRALNRCMSFQRQCRLPVVFVPGNHDHYDHHLGIFDDYAEPLAGFAAAGLHVLHSGQTVNLAGARFVGATLWTDFEINGDQEEAFSWFDDYMPDAGRIAADSGGELISGGDVLPVHRRHLAAIEAVLAVPFDGPLVVVTHHAPHPKSLRNPKFIDDSDASFASDLTKTIERFKPALWLHGHVHHSCDYRVVATRVVCNPRGYGRENRHFDPELVIDV